MESGAQLNGTQTTLFSGEALKNAGIRLASESAENKERGWNDRAYDFLENFIKERTSDFMCEDFRDYCQRHGLTAPPSLRAYGSIIVKALRNGLIRQTGYAKVSNPKAHKANAARWINSKIIEGK